MKQSAEAPNYGTITTLLPDGSPATHVMWVDCDENYVLLNTETHRAKFVNVRRDPRVSVVIWDEANPYSYAEVRGEVVETIAGFGRCVTTSTNSVRNTRVGHTRTPSRASE